MATTAPRYLFRCWSDQSHGTNSTTFFAPASITTTSFEPTVTTADHNSDFISLTADPTTTKANNEFANALRQALLWKKDLANCSFVFFTTSPIFAVQLAAWRSARKEFKDGTALEPDTGIHISILDTTTALTTDGLPVSFQAVSNLLVQHDIELRNRGDGSVRSYSNQWVATSDVILGEGSYCGNWTEMLRNGFYEVYPEVEAANDRKDPRPALTTEDLRKYFFRDEGERGWEELDTGGRVGMCFGSCSGEPGEPGEGVAPVLAFVLSLRKRDLDGRTFQTWLREHADDASNAVEDGEIVPTLATDTADLPDAEEFIKLSEYFSGFRFNVEGLASGLSIEIATIEKAKCEWAAWWKSNREEYRAAHPKAQRPGWRERHGNRPKQILERRARKDSAVGLPARLTRSTPPAPRKQRKQAYRMQQQQQSRELFQPEPQQYQQQHYQQPYATQQPREPFQPQHYQQPYQPQQPQDLFQPQHRHYQNQHQQQAYLIYPRQQPPRELFPSWRDPDYLRQPRDFDRSRYVAEPTRSGYGQQPSQGYKVLSSRPGDATTTRQQHRHARTMRQRDVDGTYVRRQE